MFPQTDKAGKICSFNSCCQLVPCRNCLRDYWNANRNDFLENEGKIGGFSPYCTTPISKTFDIIK